MWYSIETKSYLVLKYYTLVLPLLSYCHTVWEGIHWLCCNCYLITQKKLRRIISKLRRNDHTNSSFIHHKILKVHELNVYCKSIFVYKSISANNSLSDFRLNSQYFLRNENLFWLSQMQTSQSQTSILYQGIKGWNDLSSHIRDKQSLPVFKKALNNFLLSKYKTD